MKSIAITIATLAFSTSLAAAQPAAQLAHDEPHHHRPSNALALSLAGTVVPLAIMGTGIGLWAGGSESVQGTAIAMTFVGGGMAWFGPSLGHAYGEHRWVTPGMMVRSGAVVLGGLDFALVVGCGLGGGGDCVNVGFAIAGIAGAAFVTGAVIDVATASSATVRFNAQHEAPLSFAPIVIRTPSRTNVAGFGVSGHF